MDLLCICSGLVLGVDLLYNMLYNMSGCCRFVVQLLVQQIKQMEFGLSRDGAALRPNSITLQITMKVSYIRHSARTFIAVCLADGAIQGYREGRHTGGRGRSRRLGGARRSSIAASAG